MRGEDVQKELLDAFAVLHASRLAATRERFGEEALGEKYAAGLVEAIVHGEDIRRPLGGYGTYPHWAVTRALAHQIRTPVRFGGGRERTHGLTLIDAATNATYGTGPEVQASPVDLLLAVSGRPVDASRLSGPGTRRLVDPTPPLRHIQKGIS